MLNVIGYIMIGGGVLFIILALILSIVWKVPALIDEISGRKAKRQIERLRKLSVATGTLSGSDTGEFYKSINTWIPTGDRTTQEVVSKTQENQERGTSGSDLSKLIDNPYGTVGKKPIAKAYLDTKETSEKSVRESKVDCSEIKTGFLDNVNVHYDKDISGDESDFTRLFETEEESVCNTFMKISIVEEESSVDFNKEVII